MREHPLAFNVLLVDAEAPVAIGVLPRQHLMNRDRWDLALFSEEHCHLMVQMMEAWFLADPDALQGVYGPRFNRGALPLSPNVEAISKPSIEAALRSATLPTPAREYHKTRDGPRVLERLDPVRVRGAAPHCDRLAHVLASKLR